MPYEVKTITLFGVNCYLMKTSSGHVLIDTGWPFKRADLEKELESAGCKPGNLNLIILTHGDFDHAGNAAYLRDMYGAKIAMHRGELESVERGDMMLSRKHRPIAYRIFFGLVKLYGRLTRFGRFKPDLYVDEGSDLSAYGFDGRVVELPGHSTGSIGILTSDGDLFCGDLVMHDRPALHSLTDDVADLKASIEKVKSLGVKAVYPGHGTPFSPELLAEY
ncbi:MAG: MBL fold metallo-hydrolase [Anaerolineae bacterium]|nr:MBL fold metallo-hydrolase [Anaerolineae bacterium]